MVDLTRQQQESLELALAQYENRYDPVEKMVTASVSKAGYHTTLKSGTVHPTRNSLTYAVALLDSQNDAHRQRAMDILERVIGLQDQDPESRTYGIWSWYLEEPLDKMSPPDWNWADFCGVQLLAAYRRHRHRLPSEMEDMLRESIVHAARSIERRNVGPGYTNIAVMGTYVTLVTAETFNMPDLLDYAQKRAKRVYDYVTYQGSFNEYNSPTYTVVAITELSRLLMDAQDEETRRLMKEIHDMGWKHAARHFHPPTRQWAGPHSRCYATLLGERPETLAFIQAGTHGAVKFFENEPLPLGLDRYKIDFNCPKQYHSLYKTLDKEKTVVETFTKADPSRAGRKLPVIGTTFLGEHSTLGSANRADFWNQKRAVLAYWGTPQEPRYLHVRCLHDGYDYCSALVASVQKKRDLLSAVTFATDYGDTHPNLDMVKNATISARDLRLRFEFGGHIDSLELPENPKSGAPIILHDENIKIGVYFLITRFGDQEIKLETDRGGEEAYLDVVLHSGDQENIDFSKIGEACIAFCLRVQEKDKNDDAGWDALAQILDDRCVCYWRHPTETLQVSVLKKPGPRNQLQDAYEFKIL